MPRLRDEVINGIDKIWCVAARMKWDEVDKIPSLDRQEPLVDGLAELFRRI
jgi:hypothetical protein